MHMAKSDAERAAAYRRRRREEGLMQVRVWVPAELVAAVQAAIATALEEDDCDNYNLEDQSR
jgi:hypothetical protein